MLGPDRDRNIHLKCIIYIYVLYYIDIILNIMIKMNLGIVLERLTF